MRVTFAGTPTFAAKALHAIADAGHDVPLVLTQPDRPAGRRQRLSRSVVKEAALARGLRVYQPEQLRLPDQQAPVLAVPSDVMVVAAYGLILPLPILAHPTHGCLNIHASLLPRWRGAAPIQRALLAGDLATGVCIMRMDEGLDTGPVVTRHIVPIDLNETAGTLHDKLAHAGAEAIVAVLRALERDGHVASTAQDDSGVTYAKKIDKAEARINWSDDALSIERRIRALNPAPGATSTKNGSLIKIWAAKALPEREAGADAPGECRLRHDGSVIVRCGNDSLLRLDEVQPESGRRMPATEYMKGRTSDGPLRLGT